MRGMRRRFPPAGGGGGGGVKHNFSGSPFAEDEPFRRDSASCWDDDGLRDVAGSASP